MKKTYKVEVDCANCAAKIEDAICHLDGVKNARVNFMTRKMTLESRQRFRNRILGQDSAFFLGLIIERLFNWLNMGFGSCSLGGLR